MKPLRNHVLIKVDPEEKRTKSGILLHENWKSLPPKGTVKAIGPNVTDVKVGDRVIFARYAVIELDDREYPDLRMILDKHIMAIINGEKS